MTKEAKGRRKLALIGFLSKPSWGREVYRSCDLYCDGIFTGCPLLHFKCSHGKVELYRVAAMNPEFFSSFF
jgi:hypothetical protein